MSPLIEQHREELAEICRRYHVKRLELFGSGARGELRPESDLDFIVEFSEPSDGDVVRQFFGLIEDLSRLFQRPVDLVQESLIDNPYFLEDVNESRALVYHT